MTCTDDATHSPGEPDFEPAALDDDQLVGEVCRWSAQVAASTCRFVLLAAELDRRERTWSDFGVPSCAHWLNWRCGLSLGAAREHIRVGHTLARLGVVRSAFLAGEISYSKVRALTRIATETTESWLVEMAGLMTACDLERVCGTYRRAEEEGRRLADAEAARADREVRRWTTPTGQVAIYVELPPDEGAVVVAALESSLRALREERLREVEAQNRARIDAIEEADVAGDGGGDVPAETSGDDQDVPAETARPWPTMADALVSMAETAVAAAPSAHDRPESTRVVLHVDQRALEDPSNEGCCHIESIGVVPVAMAERLLCDSSLRTVRYTQGGIDLSTPSRSVPERIHRALRLRDGGCRFPGCAAQWRLHAHHVKWASMGGPTEMSNLCYLCSFHHHLVHEGGWGISLGASGEVTVRDPSGTEVHDIAPRATPAGDVPQVGPMPYGGERFQMGDVVDAIFEMEDPPDVA